MQPTQDIVIIGAGLAGSEAAWQAASRGARVTLYEMRPIVMTPAHRSAEFAELVCSNSFGSTQPDRAAGMLKRELRALGSLILDVAEETAVPAGGALAVDREAFARAVTYAVSNHPRVRVIREELRALPDDGIVICASGPLTSDALAEDIARLVGQEALAFYDAMAPIVLRSSIDGSKTFLAARYGHGGADYICCPLSEEQYHLFVYELVHAERYPLHDFERRDKRFFEACLPLEVLAERGPLALAYGPLRPRGLRDPHTGREPFAVVQLRQDNLAGSLYNLVGFQTNLLWNEQKRVFSLIPGLEHAEWVRYGQMHRNTYLNSPQLLAPTLQWRGRASLLFAGQITGTEGYVGSVASGLMAGINAARLTRGMPPTIPPATTMIGALLRYISSSVERPFQPMKANLGLLPLPEDGMGDHHQQLRVLIKREESDLETWLAQEHLLEDKE